MALFVSTSIETWNVMERAIMTTFYSSGEIFIYK